MRNKRKLYYASLLTELAGIITVICGIFIEIEMRADVSNMLITVGSVLVAIGGLLWSKVFKYSKR